MGGHVVFSHYEHFDDTLDRSIESWNWRERAAYAFMKGSDGVRRFIPYPVQNNIEIMDKVDQEKCLSGLEEVAAKYGTRKNPANFDQWLVSNFGLGLQGLKGFNATNLTCAMTLVSSYRLLACMFGPNIIS